MAYFTFIFRKSLEISVIFTDCSQVLTAAALLGKIDCPQKPLVSLCSSETRGWGGALTNGFSLCMRDDNSCAVIVLLVFIAAPGSPTRFHTLAMPAQ